MIAWLNKFWHEARDKVTVWIGVLIASASELRESWGDVTGSLPHWPWLVWVEHHAFSLLGVAVIYTRVRRSMKS